MNELLRDAIAEATSEAAKLPSEAVAVVILVFTAEGTAAPILAVDEDAVKMVTRRLGPVVDDMVAQINATIVDPIERFEEAAGRLATHAVGDDRTH